MKKRTSQRDSGMVMILVVVVVVIMVLLGLMFLQSARTQRLAIGKPDTGNIDAAIAATNQAIMNALQDDLVDKDGNFFNPNSNIDTSVDPNEETGYDEPYDYPWTNASVQSRQIHSKMSNTTYSPIGGANDDTWLASTDPKPDGTGQVTWPHITDLTGVYLGWDSHGSVDNTGTLSLSGDLPVENPVTGTANDANSDTNLTVSTTPDVTTAPQTFLYDVDGDGVPDSRWAWVPMQLINGHAYIMAVRIVDLDSMLNVNTALSDINNSGDYVHGSNTTDPPYESDPHFRTPSAWDMGSFIKDLYPPITSDWHDHLLGFLQYRMQDVGPGQTVINQEQRYDFWKDTGSYYPNDVSSPDKNSAGFFRYTKGDEMALRQGNGVSIHPSGSTPADIENIGSAYDNGLNGFLRSGDNETNWQDIDLSTYGYTGAQDYTKYLEYEPRHQLTVSSGTAIYAPWPDASANWFKLDLNHSGWDKIADRVYAVASYSGDNTMAQIVYGNGLGSTVSADAAQFTAQFIANLADYKDATTIYAPSGANDGNNPNEITTALTADQEADNGITQYTYDNGSTSTTAYGFEYMPMLSEVYIQRRYTSDTPTGSGAGGTYQVTWSIDSAAKTGYAIEIRNPYRRAVDLTSVYLYVNGQNWGALSDIIKAAKAAGQVKDNSGAAPTSDNSTYGLESHHAIIFYCDSTGTNSVNANKIGELSNATPKGMVDVTGDAIRVNLNGVGTVSGADSSVNYNDWPTAGAGNKIYVGLRSTIYDLNDSTTIIPDPLYPNKTFPYSTIPIKSFPDTTTENLGTTTAPANNGSQIDYAQRFSIGASENAGSNFINFALITGQVTDSVNDDDTASSLKLTYNQTGTPADPARDMGEDRLGQVIKDDSNVTPASVDKTKNQIILRNGDLHDAGEIANLMILGAAPPATPGDMSSARTIAVQWGTTADNISAFQLRFDPDASVNPAKYVYAENGKHANFHITYGDFMLSQFTTLSPLADGVDNDGNSAPDGSNEPLELIIPGKINLNTVPKSLLEKILPIAENNLKNAIIAKIINLRTDPARQVDGNSVKGISSLGELMRNGSDTGTTSGLIDLLTKDLSAPTSTNYSGDVQTTTQTQTGIQLDFQNLQGSGGNMQSSDSVINDNEEKTMLLKYLKQIASVRSDRFVAYVEVRGYDSSDFANGPTAIARYIAIFGRGFSGNGAARLLYMQRIK